jgi:hypothetical protein
MLVFAMLDPVREYYLIAGSRWKVFRRDNLRFSNKNNALTQHFAAFGQLFCAQGT